LVTGLVATLAGAAWPAVRAARTPPIRALLGGGGPGHKLLTLRRAAVGLALFVPGAAVGGMLWFGNTSNSALLGFGAIVTTMVMFLGMVRLAPFVAMLLVRLMARPVRRAMPAEGRLAADAAQSNPGRTAATAATLLVALSVVVVNATIASSFVGSVKSELDKRFARDLTVQPLGFQDFGPPQSGITRRLREQIAAVPDTGAVARRRSLALPDMPAGGSDGIVVGYEPREYDRVDKMDYQGAPREQVLDGLAAGGVVPAKSYAKAQDLHVGDRMRLEGPSGVRTVPVVGIADTFEAGGQAVQMSIDTMAAVYGVHNDSQLIVKAASPGQRDALDRRVEALLERDYPGLEARRTPSSRRAPPMPSTNSSASSTRSWRSP
jgi:putative ABC transport system permease protein